MGQTPSQSSQEQSSSSLLTQQQPQIAQLAQQQQQQSTQPSQLTGSLIPQNFSASSNSRGNIESPQTDPLDVPNPMTPEYINILIKAFSKSQPLKMQQVTEILSQGRILFKKLPNIIEENDPQGKQITIVGDLHGQFFDLLEIFKRNGKPSNENTYLFLGNYVDFGLFGTEIFLLLLCYKLAYPQNVHLLRGNHESDFCTKLYGFKKEVEDKYSTAVYQNFLLVFNTLPICAIINSRVFIVHGGLFNQRNVTLEKIRQINRFNEPGEEGGESLMAQMLWSNSSNFVVNQQEKSPFRCLFGPNVTDV